MNSKIDELPRTPCTNVGSAVVLRAKEHSKAFHTVGGFGFTVTGHCLPNQGR